MVTMVELTTVGCSCVPRLESVVCAFHHLQHLSSFCSFKVDRMSLQFGTRQTGPLSTCVALLAQGLISKYRRHFCTFAYLVCSRPSLIAWPTRSHPHVRIDQGYQARIKFDDSHIKRFNYFCLESPEIIPQVYQVLNDGLRLRQNTTSEANQRRQGWRNNTRPLE